MLDKLDRLPTTSFESRPSFMAPDQDLELVSEHPRRVLKTQVIFLSICFILLCKSQIMLALLEFNDRMTAFRRLEFIKNQEDKTRQTRHNNARVWSSELISQGSAIKQNLFLWIEHSSHNAGLAENYEHLTSASFHFFLSAC